MNFKWKLGCQNGDLKTLKLTKTRQRTKYFHAGHFFVVFSIWKLNFVLVAKDDHYPL
jgi:hypothetical protein